MLGFMKESAQSQMPPYLTNSILYDMLLVQRYASSGDEESDGDSAWETQPRKRSRTQARIILSTRQPHEA